MRLFQPVSWLRALSTLFINLSATWFAVALAVAAYIHRPDWPVTLTANTLSGIVGLLISMWLDELAQKHES